MGGLLSWDLRMLRACIILSLPTALFPSTLPGDLSLAGETLPSHVQTGSRHRGEWGQARRVFQRQRLVKDGEIWVDGKES